MTEVEIDPTNTFFINDEYKTMIIPVYLSLVVKDITNIVLSEGKINFNYTLKVRIAKTGLDEKAIKTISKGINLRINNILVPIKPARGLVAL